MSSRPLRDLRSDDLRVSALFGERQRRRDLSRKNGGNAAALDYPSPGFKSELQSRATQRREECDYSGAQYDHRCALVVFRPCVRPP